MDHDFIIIAVVVVIIALQCYMFLKNLSRIKAYKNIIPDSSTITLIEVGVNENEISNVEPGFILDNLKRYKPANLESESYKTEQQIIPTDGIKSNIKNDFSDQENDDENFKGLDEWSNSEDDDLTLFS